VASPGWPRDARFTIRNWYSRRQPLIPVLLLVAATALSQGAAADTLRGRVVGVADGDTVTVLAAGHARYVVRLAGIDAPEKAQPYGDRAKRLLSDLVFGADVTVEYKKHDRYGRIVGKLLRDGRDASLSMIEAGYAWHYKRYAAEQSRADRTTYDHAEDAARHAKRGLWNEDSPLPPWEWRARRRAHHSPPATAAKTG
jgi:endonuclease YncB( thermonuclease family)